MVCATILFCNRLKFSNVRSKSLKLYCISQGFSKGLNLREYAFDNIQISADGILSSDYVDEFEPSLTLNLNQTLRMHAGSRIEVSLKLERDVSTGLVR